MLYTLITIYNTFPIYVVYLSLVPVPRKTLPPSPITDVKWSDVSGLLLL